MKALFLSFIFLAIYNLSSAQLIADASNDQYNNMYSTSISTKSSSKSRISKTRKVYDQHNQSAAKQLSTYLQEQLKYSTVMEENYMEGKVILEVNISQAGTISKPIVITSPNKHMDSIILEAMQNMATIDLEDGIYFGNNRVRVSVDFSMR